MICDAGRKTAVSYEPGKGWLFYTGLLFTEEELRNVSDREQDFQRMWKTFCTSISVKSRENRKLQQQNLPLHFREYMVEFHKD